MEIIGIGGMLVISALGIPFVIIHRPNQKEDFFVGAVFVLTGIGWGIAFAGLHRAVAAFFIAMVTLALIGVILLRYKQSKQEQEETPPARFPAI